MLSAITLESWTALIIAVGALVGTGGLVSLIRAWREPPKPGTPDAAVQALAENTRALQEQGAQFKDNNKLFASVIALLTTMAKDFADTRRDMADMKHDMAEAKAHLAAIRDSLNRGSR